MTERYEETKRRIETHVARAGAGETRDIALVWEDCIAALLEWDLISPGEHSRLHELLPPRGDSPVLRIFVGFDDHLHRVGSGCARAETVQPA